MNIIDSMIPDAAIARHPLPARGIEKGALMRFASWSRTKRNATEGVTYKLPVVGMEEVKADEAVVLLIHAGKLQAFPQGDPRLTWLFSETTANCFAQDYADTESADNVIETSMREGE